MPRFSKSTVAEDNRDLNKITKERIETSMGAKGAKWVANNTDAHVGNWYAIQGIDAATINMGTSVFNGKVEQVDSTIDVIIPNGAIVYLRASSITLVSGKAILYKY